MASLSASIQALPKQLQKRILSFVKEASADTTRHIHAEWKHPSSLHVDFDTRDSFMLSYYRDGTIILIDKDIIVKWLNILDEPTAIQIMECEFRLNVPTIEIGDMSLAELSSLIRHDHLAAAVADLTASNSSYLPRWLYCSLHLHMMFASTGESAWLSQEEVVKDAVHKVTWLWDARWSALARLRAEITRRPIWDVFQELRGSGLSAE